MGRRMETCCRPVLLLVIVAAAATAVPSQHKMLSYEEAIALAVDFYNKGSGIDHAFRLLKADPQPEWDMTSNPQQELKFMVKETVCSVSENLPRTECDFRDNGVVRDCSGFFSTLQKSPIVLISCNTVTQERTHIRRSRSPRRNWWRRRWHLPGSYTLISHFGSKGKGKGKGSGLQVA
ncbi:cathelicidin-related peptide Oh-Cath-like isoform X1 [Dermochelys coriacea]|uniref:cathelicidin-related peptide Oh-Cath-like isoform X1 n=1 Tax=Dermochelys coriacea TaxID=27794 RepID=UPI0018E7616F|nr:cathelicidin-related peptide Oh-Cath-like isoform X1 [Dermochelys coriacea]